MKHYLDNHVNYFKFFVSIATVFVTLYIIMSFVEHTPEVVYEPDVITKQTIVDKKDKYTIDVSYPKFLSDYLNKEVTDYVFNYIRAFKENMAENTLNNLFIDYEVYFKDTYVNIYFIISNTVNNDTNHNIILDLENNRRASITEIYSKEYLLEKINDFINKKYPKFVYSAIINNDLDNNTFLLEEDYVTIYFKNFEINEKISYVPIMKLNIKEDNYERTNEFADNKKNIAFTFDDGPGEYTKNVTEALEYNSSNATFFMLGNKMKYRKELVLEMYSNGFEIGTHSYAHKNLTKITETEIINDLASCNNIYNEITGDNLKLVRPPYGAVNDTLKKVSSYPLILWNIDPYDWAKRNAYNTYEHVLSKAKDGYIVLMHDVYPETLEAIKMLVPELKARGFNIVSVSELAQIKNKTLANGEVITSLK